MLMPCHELIYDVEAVSNGWTEDHVRIEFNVSRLATIMA